ncbi:hypothetical protein CAP36_11910 [Chitinophagaceae bacterium IBVUCB2]|nr:hypothetical protein CAP36_11910 [Chitinophagaceae bacterium IBVUCB2]
MRIVFLIISFLCFGLIVNAQSSGTDSLPVRLSTLEARSNGNDARLDWKVVCFLDYAKFEIQRSSNGTTYTTINTFEADQLRCRQPFDYTDANISGKAFYRIKVGDLDGRIYNSKIVAVTGKEKGFEINSLTPTMVTTNALLSISSASADNAQIAIANFQGMIVKRIAVKLNKGVTELTIDVAYLAPGNYVLTLTNGFSDRKTVRFTKL